MPVPTRKEVGPIKALKKIAAGSPIGRGAGVIFNRNTRGRGTGEALLIAKIPETKKTAAAKGGHLQASRHPTTVNQRTDTVIQKLHAFSIARARAVDEQ